MLYAVSEMACVLRMRAFTTSTLISAALYESRSSGVMVLILSIFLAGRPTFDVAEIVKSWTTRSPDLGSDTTIRKRPSSPTIVTCYELVMTLSAVINGATQPYPGS
jgi:hypothetical protein